MSDQHRTILDTMPDPGQAVGHAVAAGTLLGTLLGWLPTIAALVAIIWYSLAIWEMKTVVGWRRRLHRRSSLDTHNGPADNM